MLDAAVSALVVMGDVLFGREPAADHHLVGGSDVLLRGEMIHHEGNFVFVKDLGGAHGLEALDGQRTGDVIGQHEVKPAVDDLPVSGDFFVCVFLQNFLRECLFH